MNLRLMTSTVTTTTATEAPPEMSWTAANWAAPAATQTDMPSDSMGENPLPVAVAPKASPNGSRANNTGTIALAPETNAAAAGGVVFGRWMPLSLFAVVVICDPPTSRGAAKCLCRRRLAQRHPHVIDALLRRVLGPRERGGQPKHGPVVAEHLSGKRFDAPEPGPLFELHEERLADALRLPRVFHDNGHLGLAVVTQPCVHGVANDLLFRDGDEGFLGVMIGVQHEGHHPPWHLRERRVEPAVDGLGRGAGDHRAQLLGVRGACDPGVNLRIVHRSCLSRWWRGEVTFRDVR